VELPTTSADGIKRLARPPDVFESRGDAHRRLAKIVQGRALIEQVKGVLMAIYGIDADAAFDMLKWRSQESNSRIRQLAEQLMADFLALKYAEAPPSRSTYDQIPLTVHERITDA
jgi:hypothetical protein